MRDVYSRSCSEIGLVLLSWFLVLPRLQALAQLHYDDTRIPESAPAAAVVCRCEAWDIDSFTPSLAGRR